MGILGQIFGAPPQLLEHHPIEPRGFWDNFLNHHPNFWNTTPSTRQREHQPARVGVLVQPLEHLPTEPQGPDRESGTLFDDGRSRPAFGRRKKKSCLHHFSMRADQVAARNNHVCQGQPTENQHPPFAATKTARLGPILWARPTPLADLIRRTIEPDLMQSVHPCDI